MCLPLSNVTVTLQEILEEPAERSARPKARFSGVKQFDSHNYVRYVCGGLPTGFGANIKLRGARLDVGLGYAECTDGNGPQDS